MTLEENINLVLKFINSNNLKDYSRFYKLYSISDENLTELFTRELINDKKILITGSSADQIISAQLYNPSKITHFDINPFVKHMYNLKLAAIKELNIEEFINFFNYKLDNYMSLDIETYKRIRKNLENNSLKFWDLLFKKFLLNETKESLFMISNIENNNKVKETLPYLSKDNYYKLRHRCLESVDFLECNIFDLTKNIKERYDLIYFSNILSKNITPDFYDKSYIKNLYQFMKNILRYTNENGNIILNYLHDTLKDNISEKKYHYISYPIRIFGVENNVSYFEVKSNTGYLKDTALVYTKKLR